MKNHILNSMNINSRLLFEQPAVGGRTLWTAKELNLPAGKNASLFVG